MKSQILDIDHSQVTDLKYAAYGKEKELDPNVHIGDVLHVQNSLPDLIDHQADSNPKS